MRSLCGPPHPTLFGQDEIWVGENLDKLGRLVRLGERVLAGMVKLGQRSEESWRKAGIGIRRHTRGDCWSLLESLDCWLNRLRPNRLRLNRLRSNRLRLNRLRLGTLRLGLDKNPGFSGRGRSWLASQGPGRPMLVSKENKLGRGRGRDKEQQPDGGHPGLL